MLHLGEPDMDMGSSYKTIGGRLPVRLHRVHMSLDEYPEPFKGTVRTLAVASDRGYCLQTAHLESRRLGSFARNRSIFQTTEDGNPTYPNPTTCRRRPDA